MIKISALYTGLFLIGIALQHGQAENNPPDPFDPFETLTNHGGQTELAMVAVERQRLKFLLPKLNEIYAEYWKPESFDLPQQAEVHLYPTPQHDQGITILFSVDEEVSNNDPDQQQHYRLGRMLINELKKHTPKSDSLGFFVAIDTSRSTGENVLRSLTDTRYLIPDRDEGEAFDSFEFTGNSSTVTTSELVLVRLSLAAEVFRDDYTLFLSLSGFNWKEDAHIVFEEHPYARNGVLATFKMSEEVANSDPDFNQHRRLAEHMKDDLRKIIDRLPIELDEVDFGAKIRGETPTVFN